MTSTCIKWQSNEQLTANCKKRRYGRFTISSSGKNMDSGFSFQTKQTLISVYSTDLYHSVLCAKRCKKYRLTEVLDCESECVYVCHMHQCVCVCVCERERERNRESVCVSVFARTYVLLGV